jgi:hypothetical protein
MPTVAADPLGGDATKQNRNSANYLSPATNCTCSYKKIRYFPTAQTSMPRFLLSISPCGKERTIPLELIFYVAVHEQFNLRTESLREIGR